MKPHTRPFVRHPYNYDQAAASVNSGLMCTTPTRAQQQFKDECDINTIAARFGLTGQMPLVVNLPQYGDFTSVTDYQTALNSVLAAQASFMALPPNIRERFANDPQNLLLFVSDDANIPEARELGLLPPEPIPATPVATPSP